MTDIALSGPEAVETTGRKRGGKVVKLALLLVLAGAGFGSGFAGLWSPLSVLGHARNGPAAQTAAAPTTTFLDVPRINLTLPDSRPRQLHLLVKLEVQDADAKAVEKLMPRVLDSFNTFLTGIAPEAFDRRGILEIIREELRTRVAVALPEAAPISVLIMEYALK